MMFPSLNPAFLSALCLLHTAAGLSIGISSDGHARVDIDLDLELNEALKVQHAPSASLRETSQAQPLADKDYQIELDTGIHQGRLSGDGLYVKFANIPYASPPNVTELRWAPPYSPEYNLGVPYKDPGTRKCPQAVPGWLAKSIEFSKEVATSDPTKPLDSKWDTPITPDKYGSVPEQEGDEDCLYLDVYVPKSAWNSRNERRFVKPRVMAYVHGGGFTTGSKDDIGSPKGLLKVGNNTEDDNVIFVSMNYRLGMFGWLAGSQYGFEASANLGLQDQQKAFEWVRNNIYLFGGDTRFISAMGQGAGAASVMHHLTNTRSRYSAPVFARSILHSPSFFPYQNDSVYNAVYAEILSEAKVKDIDKLAELDGKKLRAINAKIAWKALYGHSTFGPAPDGSFVRDSPGKHFVRGEFHRVGPTLIGHTGLDGLAVTPPWIRDADGLKKHLRSIYGAAKDDALKKITDLYPIPATSKNGPAQRAQIAAVADMISDMTTKCNVYAHTQAVTKDNYRDLAYRYIFGAGPSVYGSDLNYVFYPETPLTGLGAINETLANVTQTRWVNFVRYSDPFFEDEDGKEKNQPEWEVYTNETRKVAMFGHTQSFDPSRKGDSMFTVEKDPMTDARRRMCDFWLEEPLAAPSSGRSAGLLLQQNELRR